MASNAHPNPANLAAAQPIALTGLSQIFPLPTIKHTTVHKINLQMLHLRRRIATIRVMLRCHGALTGLGGLTMVRCVPAALRPGRVLLGCTSK
jgi:hypothetical protein